MQEDLSAERYKEILNYELASEVLSYYPVYTIRSPKGRQDEKAKTKFGMGKAA